MDKLGKKDYPKTQLILYIVRKGVTRKASNEEEFFRQLTEYVDRYNQRIFDADDDYTLYGNNNRDNSDNKDNNKVKRRGGRQQMLPLEVVMFNGTLSAVDTVNLFRRARIIVGAHGAGHSNIVFAESASVIEITFTDAEGHFGIYWEIASCTYILALSSSLLFSSLLFSFLLFSSLLFSLSLYLYLSSLLPILPLSFSFSRSLSFSFSLSLPFSSSLSLSLYLFFLSLYLSHTFSQLTTIIVLGLEYWMLPAPGFAWNSEFYFIPIPELIEMIHTILPSPPSPEGPDETDCPRGSVFDTRKMSCLPCPAGTFHSLAIDKCVGCGLGRFNPKM